jgi:hypothetical protein
MKSQLQVRIHDRLVLHKLQPHRENPSVLIYISPQV